MTYVFPAVFTASAEGYAIRFPDLPGTNSQGKDMAEALRMARAALAEWLDMLLDEEETIPAPSNPADIVVSENGFVSLIDVDMEAYRRRKNSRAVKKTLTIPAWLNEEAEAKKLNFSAVLQEGLKRQLGISDR